MKTYRKAFYKAKFGDGKWLDDGISIWTTFVNVVWLACTLKFRLIPECVKRRYSHEETWLMGEVDGFPCFSVQDIGSRKPRYVGTCFTSTRRDKNDGTVIRDAQDVIGKHPKRWDIMEITVSDRDYEAAVEWRNWQVEHNQGYNIKSIMGFFWPFRKTVISYSVFETPPIRKNICSVAGQGFDWMAGVFDKWMIWSPIRHWMKLNAKGYTTRPLR